MIFTACQCDSDGSRNQVCDRVSGQCRCYDDITNRTCDTCVKEGFYGPIKHRCRPCKCNSNNTMECVKVS